MQPSRCCIGDILRLIHVQLKQRVLMLLSAVRKSTEFTDESVYCVW